MGVQPRPGAAALAVVEEDRVRRAGDGDVEIGIRQNDRRRLAAEFQRHFLQIAGRRLDDQLADFGRAGESDLVDVRMRGERRAGGFAEPGQDVDHARREAGFLDQLSQAQRGHRRLFGGFQHDGATRSQRRRDLPARHQQREIPGDDLADDAHRLAHRVGQVFAAAATASSVEPVILVAQPAM